MNSFDDIIQQKANDHKAPVPQDAWANIDKKGRKKRRIFFWWMTAALFCGLLTVIYYNKNKEITPAKQVAINKIADKAQPGNASDANKTTRENSSLQQPETGSNNMSEQGDKEQNKKPETADKAGNTGNKYIISKKKTNDLTANTNNIATENKNNITNSSKTGEQKPVRSFTAKTNNRIVSSARENKKDKDDHFASRQKISGKQKGKTQFKVEQGETAVSSETKNETSNKTVSVNKEIPANENQEKVPAENINSVALNNDNKKQEPTSPAVVKKELAVDSTQHKTVATAPDENKKQKTSLRKQSKNHSWFLDVAATPIFPIQQYDKAVSFNRTLFFNNTKSEFNGNLAKTSVDPSVAFSVSLKRSFSKKFFAGIGVQYLQLKESIVIAGTQTNTDYTVVDRLVNSINGPELVKDTIETVSAGQRNISATNSYSFVSIPVFIQYNFVQRSWSVGAVAGMFVNVYSSYQDQINKNNPADLVNVSQQIADKNKLSFSLYGGLRIGKYAGKRVEIFALPSIIWTPGTQDVKNSLINKKIQQPGVSVGISYKLR